MGDELALAWAKVNLILDTKGDSPEYREAFNEIEYLVKKRQEQ